METFLYFASSCISAFCSLALLMLFVRAVLSWFPGQGGTFERFVQAVTEPILYPVRRLFDIFDIRPNLPIDISFTVTVVLLVLIDTIVTSF
ncbi:MAG: YggT family protein [Clostridia bacterium]|nr:YggT family protein [Clostridia bacterium]